MSPAKLSVRQPVFIASIVILIMALGFLALKKLPIDLFPDVNFPTIVVVTTYPGAGPQEVESGVTRVLEDEVSSISGVKKVSSQNQEGFSLVMVEFDLKSDLDYAEQQVRAKVTNALKLLPDDVDAPITRKVSPSDAPILGIALLSEMDDADLYDLAKEKIAPQFEQVDQVGQVDIVGGRKREIHIQLDREKLRNADISASAVVNALSSGGRNVPIGKTTSSTSEYTYRTLAEYKSLADISNSVLRVADISYPITVGKLGTIVDSLQDETSRSRFNGTKSLLFNVFRQSGANSVKVADDVNTKLLAINKDLEAEGIPAKLQLVNDASRKIRANVFDVYESIFFGTLLTIIVVYFFLGSMKSTLITGFALPNSILGAFIFMLMFGFSINIMSLLAISLVVGLLVDDAIVVRENIFRKLEEGLSPKKAAVLGTEEVTLAVIATTATILAVFGPIGNLEGIVGQFFKEFGLTVCFAMLVSLFDGLFVAPALSAYMGGGAPHATPAKSLIGRWNARLLKGFDRFQSMLERYYVKWLGWCIHNPFKTLLASVLVFIASILVAKSVPFTFMSAQDNGEFFVQFELPVGASLDATDNVTRKIEETLRAQPQIEDLLSTIGSTRGESNTAYIYIRLVPSKQRKENTTETKKIVQEALKPFAEYRPIVTDQAGQSGGGGRAFNLNIVGQNLETLVPFSEKVLERLKQMPALSQADSTYRSGRPEFQVVLKHEIAAISEVTMASLGMELRTQIEGRTPALFREDGIDYDIRVRLQEDQRNLQTEFNRMMVPNLSQRLVPLSNVAKLVEATGPTTILRENRTRYIQLSADLTPGGAGLGGAITELQALFKDELKPPPGVSFSFVGEAERFAELMTNMLVSLGLGMLFIFLVIASLFGSFFTPFTIMLVIPLAACGAFLSLALTGSSFDLFSMIGCVMLMGLATKNSILLIDFALERQREGIDRYTALLKAGETRLRPILMTSLALIAGMVPVAIGLNEASKQRTSLGIVVIGGTISSTLLTLVVIPAAHVYIDRFQNWFMAKYHKIFGHDETVI
ncbi:MAG: efflux RND transporter permease subunit [Bdellovibrionales bacterium]|jgi:hydrophobe/amphiphile efflux-1 (HAE1) family protein|nr:efflux RND transporter permease subunit [Bdellovibrionales bacterium]